MADAGGKNGGGRPPGGNGSSGKDSGKGSGKGKDAGKNSGSSKNTDTAGRGGAKGGGGPVLMTLDGRVHHADEPFLCADDLSALRGDGVFETLLVRGGAPCLLDEHLDRLERSAEAMDLPKPDVKAWRGAAEAAAERWGSDQDGKMRLLLTRGREGTASPTAFLMVSSVGAVQRRAGEDGVGVITLDAPRSVDVAQTSPWALAGAKTLSYAENMAALRYARKKGADDVIFVSAEGYVLEAPRATVVVARDGDLITPPVEHGVLAGTTQRALFRVARGRGMTCRYAPLRPADLVAADGVWLLSSVTLVASVRSINGVEIGRSDLDGRLRTMVDEAVAGAREESVPDADAAGARKPGQPT